MNKNELEFAKAQLGAAKVDAIIKLIRHVVSALALLVGLWITFDGLHKVIAGQSPDGITAFAKVIDALKLGSIFGYLWGAGASVAWLHERRGKKRAISKKSKYQQIVESSDSYRSTSGLTETGDTPVEEVS